MAACKTTVIVGNPTASVTIRPAQNNVVTLNAATAAAIQARRTAIEVADRRTAVTVADRAPRMSAGGNIGQQGPPGPAGGAIAPIAFSFGDASGVIWTAPASGTVTVARVSVDLAFDDPAATLSLGVPFDHGAVFPSSSIEPSLGVEFEHTADFHLASGTSVYIYIYPGLSTQGAGTIFLTFIPD